MISRRLLYCQDVSTSEQLILKSNDFYTLTPVLRRAPLNNLYDKEMITWFMNYCPYKLSQMFDTFDYHSK